MLYNKRSTVAIYSKSGDVLLFLVEQKKSVTAFFSVWLSSHFIAIYCVISKEIVPFMRRCFGIVCGFFFPCLFAFLCMFFISACSGDVFIRVDQALSKRCVCLLLLSTSLNRTKIQSPSNPNHIAMGKNLFLFLLSFASCLFVVRITKRLDLYFNIFLSHSNPTEIAKLKHFMRTT